MKEKFNEKDFADWLNENYVNTYSIDNQGMFLITKENRKIYVNTPTHEQWVAGKKEAYNNFTQLNS